MGPALRHWKLACARANIPNLLDAAASEAQWSVLVGWNPVSNISYLYVLGLLRGLLHAGTLEFLQ